MKLSEDRGRAGKGEVMDELGEGKEGAEGSSTEKKDEHLPPAARSRKNEGQLR